MSLPSSTTTTTGRIIPISAIVLLALAVHGPLLLMQIPARSYDAYNHMFFASHYAQHWFNPWNEKWFAGFSQTTYPPLTHQLIALFSHLVGLNLAYMLVQGLVILLLPIGMYRFAKLWVDERSATYAAIGSIFLGSLAMLVYHAGQLPTTFASVLVLNSLPFFYDFIHNGRGTSLVKGVAITMVAAAGHHVTTIFGLVLFATPVLFLAFLDKRRDTGEETTAAGVVVRMLVYAGICILLVGVVLAPYWLEIYRHPIQQAPIAHESRDNYILSPFSGEVFFLVPYGALLLALPFVFFRGGGDRRLRPLFFGWFVTFLIGLGGTTPFPRWVLGRVYEILTYERFIYWSTLLVLPIVGLLMGDLIRRYSNKAIIGISILAVGSFAAAVSFVNFHPISSASFDSDSVVQFMNRDGHDKYRYLTLGFAEQFDRVSMLTDASSVDGDYNSARMLPELTQSGAAKLDNAKYYGAKGMEALRAMLRHANQYGLKYIFVRDPYYDPLLAFAGWRPQEVYDRGAVTMWSKEDVPPARRIEGTMKPTFMEGLLWGTLPLGSLLLALGVLIMLPERRRQAQTVEFPSAAQETTVYREAN